MSQRKSPGRKMTTWADTSRTVTDRALWSGPLSWGCILRRQLRGSPGRGRPGWGRGLRPASVRPRLTRWTFLFAAKRAGVMAGDIRLPGELRGAVRRCGLYTDVAQTTPAMDSVAGSARLATTITAAGTGGEEVLSPVSHRSALVQAGSRVGGGAGVTASCT